MAIDPRAVIAAHNNADLYAAMFASHDLAYERLPYAFVGRDRPPPYYSNLTVLSPGHSDEIAAQLHKLADRFNGVVGLKDSFCELDLEANGFEMLFGASWIWREAGLRSGAVDWQRIETEADLCGWEAAWKLSGSPAPHRMFRAGLLDRPDIVFLARRDGDAIMAGCIANVSDACIGISNLFARELSDDDFAEAAAAVASVAPHLPIAGYESGQDLQRARNAGFETVGALRVLVTGDARF
jgi:hypothetical protein